MHAFDAYMSKVKIVCSYHCSQFLIFLMDLDLSDPFSSRLVNDRTGFIYTVVWTVFVLNCTVIFVLHLCWILLGILMST